MAQHDSINTDEFVEEMKLFVVQGGAVALELQGQVENIGKTVTVPTGSEKDDDAQKASKRHATPPHRPALPSRSMIAPSPRCPVKQGLIPLACTNVR